MKWKIALASGAILRKEQVEIGALRQAGTAKIRVCLSLWRKEEDQEDQV